MSSGYSDKVYEEMEKLLGLGGEQVSYETGKIFKFQVEGSEKGMLCLWADQDRASFTPATGADIGGAMDLVKAGYRVTRDGWKGGISVRLDSTGLIKCMATRHEHDYLPDIQLLWHPTSEDLLATDWRYVSHG